MNKQYIYGGIGFLIIVFTMFLLVCDPCDNPLYNMVKPTVENRYYVLNAQYVGDITNEGKTYTNCLIFDVQPLNTALNPVGDEHRLYFANENMLRSDLKDNEIIVVTWLHQINSVDKISGVISKEMNDNLININFQ